MRMLLIASLAAISACSAAATQPQLAGRPAEPAFAYDAPISAVSARGVDCDVRAVRTSHGVRLEASAISDLRASGEYDFVITKRDRGGSSDIVQGGEYSLAPGAVQSLGSAEISVARGGGYRARLVLRDRDGIACRAEIGR